MNYYWENVEIKKWKSSCLYWKNDVKFRSTLQRGMSNSSKIFMFEQREFSKYEPLALIRKIYFSPWGELIKLLNYWDETDRVKR